MTGFLLLLIPFTCLQSTYYLTNALRDATHKTYKNIYMFRHRGTIIRNLLQQRYTSQPANLCFGRLASVPSKTHINPVILHTYLPMKMERTECSETSAYKIQTPGNYPEESIKHISRLACVPCHLGGPGLDERIILRWIFKKWDVGA